jgi:hypothetical protein
MVRTAHSEDDLDAFLLSLPLGTGKNAVILEEAIGTRLRCNEEEKIRFQRQSEAWCACNEPVLGNLQSCSVTAGQ